MCNRSAKEQHFILKTEGGVIRTIGVHYKQYSNGKKPVQQLSFFHILTKVEYAHL